MLKIRANQKLRDLGWKQLLQIHDELIMEVNSEREISFQLFAFVFLY
jgi:DNA polymerase I-like protein with 3'-5' exonuclease and polymerase domains